MKRVDGKASVGSHSDACIEKRIPMTRQGFLRGPPEDQGAREECHHRELPHICKCIGGFQPVVH
eukprot:15513874-Heterocapsa_arctica.AAC.1